VWSAVVLALASLPVVVGYLMSDQAHTFLGTTHNLSDMQTYLAKMQQGYAGSWSVRLLFTPEPHPGIPLLYPTYLLLGHVARWTGAPLFLVYHIARLLCGAFLLWTVYRFIAFILPEPTWRWTAFLLTTIASGFGVWVVLVAGTFETRHIIPIDLWPMGHLTFATLLSAPHHMLGLAFFFITLQSVITYWETASPGWVLAASLAALGEGFTLTFMPLVYGTVLALAWIFEPRWRRAPLKTAGAGLWVVLLPLPIVLHYWSGMNRHPVWISFSQQNVTPSPHLWDYGLGYGLVGIFALLGSRWAWRSGPRGRLALLIPVVSLALAYAPVNFQRRLIVGAFLPLCVLAAAGIHGWLFRLWQSRRPASRANLLRRENLVIFGMVDFSAISNLYVLVTMLFLCVSHSPNLYLPADSVAGIGWLGANTPGEATILSSFSTGGAIPAFTGRRVFWGHPYETAYVDQKSEWVAHFFSESATDDERLAMLKDAGITHLFYGPNERAQADFDPASVPFLTPVFRNDSVTIYQVQSKR
jgi:hypothetical protein